MSSHAGLDASRATPAGASQAGAEAALLLRGVRRSWGPREVLRGIDLAVAPGRVIWLGGRNGVGKTTLLRIAAGLLAPQSGEVRLFGLDPDRDRRAYQTKLGYLPAGNGGLYARLTVRQNMEFWASLALMSPSLRRDAITRSLERFELAELERRRVDRLSMGQRQRVRIAMTFLHEPDFILLDEPHTSLDDEGLAVLQEAFAAHRARRGSGIWCSPSTTHAALDFDEGFVIEDGVVREA